MQVTAPIQPPAPASAWAFTWRNVPPLAAALALGFGVLFAVRVLFRPIAILLLAITLGEAVAPIVGRLERRMPRTAAIALVYLGLVLIAGLVGWGIVPDLSQQIRDLAHPIAAGVVE
jgi:predicted PurR-regulated permease PerM